MNESDWRSSSDPFPMLQFLGERLSDRKLRLFAVACCRRLRTLLDDDFGARSLEAAERCAEGLISVKDLWRLGVDWNFALNYELHETHASTSGLNFNAVRCAMFAAGLAMGRLDWKQTYNITNWTAKAVGVVGLGDRYDELSDDYDDVDKFIMAAQPFMAPEMAAQAALLRDIFRHPSDEIGVDRSWKSTEVVGMAAAIYKERCFDRLPLLADELEKTGCDNRDLLAHCQSRDPHTRGCWVLDAVLGKA